jgi:beta-lactamase class D
MGFDQGILKTAHKPVWTPEPDEDVFLPMCKSPHTPRGWMRDSCVWYSQHLTKRMGMDVFQRYVTAWDYGNKDVSGDVGKNNGLTHSWLSSSLAVSPEEQVVFLQRMVSGGLGVGKAAFKHTKEVVFIQEYYAGWNLYGKTGNGRILDKDKKETSLQHGWFVGWMERGDEKIFFAAHTNDDTPQKTFASFRTRYEALNRLFELVNTLEK